MPDPLAALRDLRGPLAVLAAMIFVGQLGVGVMLPIIPLYAIALGASPRELGLLTTAFSLANVVAQLGVGFVLGRGAGLVIVDFAATLRAWTAPPRSSASGTYARAAWRLPKRPRGSAPAQRSPGRLRSDPTRVDERGRGEPCEAVVRIAGMRWVLGSVMTVVIAAACGTPAGSGGVPLASNGPAAASLADATQAASRTATGAPGTPGGAPAAAGTAARVAFLSHVFTDVRDGKQFTLGDFQGKLVFVIGMAVW